ncbi:Mannosyltransferase [Pleurostoma richardsiae]|uniref:Mannosyltransferase n=1 Tax=Pleurostoma richardsiae TaxID=41990 RepID=A0AA38VN81_9PEZI|nr:Mannosyltransferase [Pleurostoma richardsiae]
MWRRTYLFLVLIRLWFALSPSYLHPDENFQGPEVIAGEIFDYPVRRTWEFTSEYPIRSVFPLWPVYGLPMLLLRWLWIGNGNDGEIPPIAVFWTLRVLMFILSFVLEDWAIHELVQSPRQRRVAVLLVASSYVTWTYQTHTFSNSIETLVVAWSLVLIERILATPPSTQRTPLLAPTVLGVVVVFGVFNRITFPTFLLIPGLRLIPYFWKRPWALLAMLVAASLTTILAVILDTAFYTPHPLSWMDLIRHPVFTPLNNLLYNVSPENLAKHGLHPWYQHLLVNLPQLIGPTAVLLFAKPYISLRLYSAISGITVLSIFQHQEARFLLPTIPLLLSSIQLPKKQPLLRIWVGSWIIFNAVFGILMGVYHQGGIVPGQVFMSRQPDATHAIWWKTYMPPIWLLNGKNEVLTTRDVMGMDGPSLLLELEKLATCDTPADRRNHEYLKEKNGTYLIAPLSATWLDPYLPNKGLEGLRFREVWRHTSHLNLDDLDFAEDGVWNTLSRPQSQGSRIIIAKMGGFNLEAFKFGMYVLFPIGFMYYFGVNLDNRFAVPDFWPKPEEANKVPLEKDEIRAELERLRARRLYNRERRLAEEAKQQQLTDQNDAQS